MTEGAQENLEAARRQKSTKLLMIGGVASLLLPLIGVIYLKLHDSGPPPLPIGMSVFAQRAKTLTPAAVPAPAQTPAAANSLNFIKKEDAFFTENEIPPQAEPAPQPEPAEKEEPAKKAPASSKKEFKMPRLQRMDGYTSGTSVTIGGRRAGTSDTTITDQIAPGQRKQINQLLDKLPSSQRREVEDVIK